MTEASHVCGIVDQVEHTLDCMRGQVWNGKRPPGHSNWLDTADWRQMWPQSGVFPSRVSSLFTILCSSALSQIISRILSWTYIISVTTEYHISFPILSFEQP